MCKNRHGVARAYITKGEFFMFIYIYIGLYTHAVTDTAKMGRKGAQCPQTRVIPRDCLLFGLFFVWGRVLATPPHSLPALDFGKNGAQRGANGARGGMWGAKRGYPSPWRFITPRIIPCLFVCHPCRFSLCAPWGGKTQICVLSSKNKNQMFPHL